MKTCRPNCWPTVNATGVTLGLKLCETVNATKVPCGVSQYGVNVGVRLQPRDVFAHVRQLTVKLFTGIAKVTPKLWGSGCVRIGFFFFSSRRRHTRCLRDWSSDVCSSD